MCASAAQAAAKPREVVSNRGTARRKLCGKNMRICGNYHIFAARKFGNGCDSMNPNADYYAIILLLRRLKESGLFSEKELQKTAAKIKAELGATLIISL